MSDLKNKERMVRQWLSEAQAIAIEEGMALAYQQVLEQKDKEIASRDEIMKKLRGALAESGRLLKTHPYPIALVQENAMRQIMEALSLIEKGK